MNRDIKIILIGITILLTGYFSFLALLNYILTPPPISRSISIEVLNKINYNKNDSIFITEDCENREASFWATTETGDIELFRISYTSKKVWLKETNLCEEVKYRHLDNYIYFWFNGVVYETDELNDSGPDIEYRNYTDALVYKYNIENSEYEKIEIEDAKKTIIIDILKNEDKELIIKEVAVGPNKGKWNEMATFVDVLRYDFTTTNRHQGFNIRAITFNNKIILPTYNQILVLSDGNIERYIKYSIDYPYVVELYQYNDNLISIVDQKFITKYDDNFEILDEIEILNEFSDNILIHDKIVLYNYDRLSSNVIIGYIDLESFQFSFVEESFNNTDIIFEELGIKYNKYTDTLIIYDKENGQLFYEVDL